MHNFCFVEAEEEEEEEAGIRTRRS